MPLSTTRFTRSAVKMIDVPSLGEQSVQRRNPLHKTDLLCAAAAEFQPRQDRSSERKTQRRSMRPGEMFPSGRAAGRNPGFEKIFQWICEKTQNDSDGRQDNQRPGHYPVVRFMGGGGRRPGCPLPEAAGRTPRSSEPARGSSRIKITRNE